jgi:hypothetical protein
MNVPGSIIQGTYGHASKMQALAPDSPVFYEVDFFSGRSKAD